MKTLCSDKSPSHSKKSPLSTTGHERKPFTSDLLICLNCGKQGHIYRNCKSPLQSYGILLFRVNPQENVEYLMICRRHSFGFVEMVRVNFDIKDKTYIRQLISEMTIDERNKIRSKSFRELWLDLWQISSIEQTTRSRYEYHKTEKRFESLRRSNIFRILDSSVESEWVQPEWGFPKGKRNLNEQPLECAIREMQEETGIQANAYKLCDHESMNRPPAIELFQGTDGRKYKHIYYYAQLTEPHLYAENPTIDSTNLLQVREISEIKWCTYEDCLKRIRSYNTAKLQLIEKVHLSIYSYLHKKVHK